MIDYEQTKADALQQKAKLVERQQEIAKEKSRLDEELQSIQRQLIGLDQILEGLDVATLQVPPDIEPMGFTDHIRMILQQTTVHLLPTQIRDSCLNAGFKGSSLKNLLISVHNVLERDHANLDEKQIEGKTAYKWKTTVQIARPRLAELVKNYPAIEPPPGYTPRTLGPAIRRRRRNAAFYGELQPPPQPSKKD
jgi:hypothetical protein